MEKAAIAANAHQTSRRKGRSIPGLQWGSIRPIHKIERDYDDRSERQDESVQGFPGALVVAKNKMKRGQSGNAQNVSQNKTDGESLQACFPSSGKRQDTRHQ